MVSNNMGRKNEKDKTPELTQEELAELSKEIEFEKLSEEVKITDAKVKFERTTKTNFKILDNMLSEYLDTFVVMGYNSDSDEIIFHNIRTPKDQRAILSLLEDVYSGRMLDNIGPSHMDDDDDDEYDEEEF